MKTRLLTLLTCLCMVPTLTCAQEDDFTSDLFYGGITSTDVLPKYRLQWESFVGYQRTRMSDLTIDDWAISSNMLRFGVTNNSEVRLTFALLNTKYEDVHKTGFGNVSVGVKTQLYEGKGWIPSVAVMGHLYFPGGKDNEFMPENFSSQLALMASSQLTPWFSITGEYLMGWADSESPYSFFGATLGFDLSDKLSLSVEESNTYTKTNEDNKVNPSISAAVEYRIHRKASVGFEASCSLDEQIHGYSLVLGFAWQLTK